MLKALDSDGSSKLISSRLKFSFKETNILNFDIKIFQQIVGGEIPQVIAATADINLDDVTDRSEIFEKVLLNIPVSIPKELILGNGIEENLMISSTETNSTSTTTKLTISTTTATTTSTTTSTTTTTLSTTTTTTSTTKKTTSTSETTTPTRA